MGGMGELRNQRTQKKILDDIETQQLFIL